MKYIFLCIIGLIASGCAATPGPFAGGNYQQMVLEPQNQISQVTVLRPSPGIQKELITKSGTLVIGKSVFRIDSDDLDDNDLEAQARAQAKIVNANTVLLSQTYCQDRMKTKIIEKKSEFQQAAENTAFVMGGSKRTGSASSSTETVYTPTGSQSTTKGHSSSFGVAGAATLGDITALIPGSIVHEEINYDVKVYEIHAIYLRTPIYPGLN